VSAWNYRITRETITNPDGTTEAMYACREVHYDGVRLHYPTQEDD